MKVELSLCPHMPARCPHKSDWCKDWVNSNCHYVISTTNSAAMVLTMLQGQEGLSREMVDHLRGMESLLAKVGKQLER
jgi:hypothetical protein